MGGKVSYRIVLECVLTDQQASDLDDLLDDNSIVPTRYDVTPTSVEKPTTKKKEKGK